MADVIDFFTGFFIEEGEELVFTEDYYGWLSRKVEYSNDNDL